MPTSAGGEPNGKGPASTIAALERRLLAAEEALRQSEARNERISRGALHDDLTGLPKRLLFLDRVTQALARTTRVNTRAAIFFCDLDHFHVVNDGMGLAIGDKVLAVAANRLRNSLRPTDVVARFGGDEFVILCEVGPGGSDVATVADRVLDAFTSPFELDGQTFILSASIGVAVAENRLIAPEDLVSDAAAAASRAKREGGGTYMVSDQDIHDRAVGRLRIESALRRALNLEELEVFYQPVVESRGGRLVGVEALVRWHHPEHGLVLPTSFIPVAEDSGLIVELGSWVLEQACHQAAQWQKLVPAGARLRVSINLSTHQLHDKALVSTVRHALAELSADPRSVVIGLEVTESAVLRDTERIAQVFDDLSGLGIEFDIDDFGTGYSSLHHLKRFPVSTIKIDQSFVENITTDPQDQAIVAAIVQLADSLDLTTIAEGVERIDQRDLLTTMGCDLLQGYLFGRPLIADALTTVLRRSGSELPILDPILPDELSLPDHLLLPDDLVLPG